MTDISGLARRVRENVSRVIVGKEDIVELLLCALVAGGHVLLEDVPGTGKTVMAKALARSLDCRFARIQFTPDLLPADVTGMSVYNMREGTFSFEPGPVFTHILLADEINRATPKTQSALLEAMQEHTVTVGGVTRPLPEPYFVLATQNPLEQEGTYPLPEAQLDRFLLKLLVPFPTLSELHGIVDITVSGNGTQAEPVADGEDILAMRAMACEVPVARAVQDYALRLVLATHPELPDAPESTRSCARFGASPRAAQALISVSRVRALMEGRFNVAFDDIRAVAPAVLRHRVAMSFEGLAAGMTPDRLIQTLLSELKAG